MLQRVVMAMAIVTIDEHLGDGSNTNATGAAKVDHSSQIWA